MANDRETEIARRRGPAFAAFTSPHAAARQSLFNGLHLSYGIVAARTRFLEI
jgi:hypothetical protein